MALPKSMASEEVWMTLIQAQILGQLLNFYKKMSILPSSWVILKCVCMASIFSIERITAFPALVKECNFELLAAQFLLQLCMPLIMFLKNCLTAVCPPMKGARKLDSAGFSPGELLLLNCALSPCLKKCIKNPKNWAIIVSIIKTSLKTLPHKIALSTLYEDSRPESKEELCFSSAMVLLLS